jgi:PhnB protein
MTNPIPEGFHTITPYFAIKNAASAIEFYQNAFGATVMLRVANPDGSIMHAEIKIGNSMLMLSEAHSDTQMDSPVSMFLYVEDVQAFAKRAVAAGATWVEQLKKFDEDGDLRGGLKDPFGFTWWIASHVDDLSREEMQRRFDDLLKQGS